MVRHPVEPHLHVERVGGSDKSLQVTDGAVLRIGLLEVGGGIGAVDAATTRIDGHEPQDVDTQGFQFAKAFLCGGKSAGLRERADVHLVNHLMACFILCRG